MKKNYILVLLFILITSVTSAQLVLNEVLFDPASDVEEAKPGDANRSGTRGATSDEFIEFINSGDTPLVITGYKIYDATKFALLPGSDEPRHIVGDDDEDGIAETAVVIPAGGIYVVFGGGGTLSDIRQDLPTVTFETASSGNLNLTNNGEIITVTDALYDGNGLGNVLITFDDDNIEFANGRTEGTPAVAETFNLSGEENQSLTRYPTITGDFGYHLGLNGQHQSPGEIPSLPTGDNLVINEIFASPGPTTGDANGDGLGGTEDEFLEIINTSNQAIDISGYKFFDRTNLFLDGISAVFSGTPRHIVPVSTIIPAGEAYVVFSGGTLTADFGIATVHTASSSSLSLSDTGDFMIISDTNNNYVTSFGSNSVVDTWNGFEAYTRNPDITGNFVKHRDVVAARFSPGTKTDGTNFSAALSVDNFLENKINLYLTNNNILKVDGNLEGENQLKVYNMLGKEVYKNTFQTKTTNNFNLSSLAKGIYIVDLSNSLYKNLNKKILIK